MRHVEFFAQLDAIDGVAGVHDRLRSQVLQHLLVLRTKAGQPFAGVEHRTRSEALCLQTAHQRCDDGWLLHLHVHVVRDHGDARSRRELGTAGLQMLLERGEVDRPAEVRMEDADHRHRERRLDRQRRTAVLRQRVDEHAPQVVDRRAVVRLQFGITFDQILVLRLLAELADAAAGTAAHREHAQRLWRRARREHRGGDRATGVVAQVLHEHEAVAREVDVAARDAFVVEILDADRQRFGVLLDVRIDAAMQAHEAERRRLLRAQTVGGGHDRQREAGERTQRQVHHR